MMDSVKKRIRLCLKQTKLKTAKNKLKQDLIFVMNIFENLVTKYFTVFYALLEIENYVNTPKVHNPTIVHQIKG